LQKLVSNVDAEELLVNGRVSAWQISVSREQNEVVKLSFSKEMA